MRMKLVAFVMALGLVGCGPHPDPLHGDVTFTADEREAIERGNVWMAERVGRAPYDIVWDLPHPSDPGGDARLVIVRGVECSDCGGRTNPYAHVELAPADSDRMAMIAAHEFGHTWGLRHLPDDVAGIMNPTPWLIGMTWTPADQAQCVADGVCR